MKSRFEDLQIERNGKALKLLQDQPHRWLGTVRLMERFLLLWDNICVHYHRTELRPFPVEPQRKLLIELFSVMKPVAEIMISAQSGDTVKSIDTYLAVCNLHLTILDESAALPLRDPALDSYEKGLPVRLEPHSLLEEVTKKTRRLLRDALVKRFYDGYNGTPRPLCYEMAVFLHPAYRKLACVERYMCSGDAQRLRETVKAEIHSMAVVVAKANPSVFMESQEPSPKKSRSESPDTGKGIWNFSSFEEPHAEPSEKQRVIEDDVMDEIDRYVENETVKATDVPSRKLLKWWKARTNRYPNLSTVARVVLAHPASSAAIERDFGLSGLVLSPSRNRTDAAFVDMQLFLRTHLSKIPAHVPELSGVNWMERVPNRFTGIEEIEHMAMTSEEDCYEGTEDSSPQVHSPFE